MWECTGGSVKAGESSKDATIREIEEEIGIELKTRRRTIFRDNTAKKIILEMYGNLKEIYPQRDIFYNDGEVIDSKWVLLDEYV